MKQTLQIHRCVRFLGILSMVLLIWSSGNLFAQDQKLADDFLHLKSDRPELALNKTDGVSISKNTVFDVTVSGVVRDQNGEPIPGATVSVPGTNLGTATDMDGKYSITVPEGSNLVFSFIGFDSQTVTLGNQQVLDITLNESISSLQEVVVVGYGTQQKVNLTGAVGVATSERLQNRPIANVGEGLQGVIPNLNIAPRNGDPSASPAFNVRGFQSINGG